jgi:hypothetical protein
VSSYEAAAGAPAVAGAPPAGLYFSMSSLVIWPPLPEPLMEPIGTPFSSASFLTAGETPGWRWRAVCRRSPVDSDSMAVGADSSLAGGAVLEPESAGSLASEASPFLEGVSGFLSPPASSMEKFSKAETSSPSSTRTAIGYEVLVHSPSRMSVPSLSSHPHPCV